MPKKHDPFKNAQTEKKVAKSCGCKKLDDAIKKATVEHDKAERKLLNLMAQGIAHEQEDLRVMMERALAGDEEANEWLRQNQHRYSK